MHEINGLWKYYGTHHLTKHLNPLPTLYADTEPEFFDIAVVPLATYFTMKLMGMLIGFYEWWICLQYIVYAELAGHSGLRVYGVTPSTLGFAPQFFNTDISVGDHHLHPRRGWRKSYDYGKQTRLWDHIFGTYHERIESALENFDYTNQVLVPLW